jgi:hypothetical protein
MGFSIGLVGVSCDECGGETESVELTNVVGGFTLDGARNELDRDGWLVSADDKIICPECAAEISEADQ